LFYFVNTHPFALSDVEGRFPSGASTSLSTKRALDAGMGLDCFAALAMTG